MIIIASYGKYVIPVIFVAVLLLAIFIIKPFIVSLISGAIIAYAFYPLFKLINRRIKSRTTVAIIVSFIILLIIILPVVLIVNTLSQDAYVFYLQGKEILQQGNLLGACTSSVCTAVKEWLADPLIISYLQRGLGTVTTFMVQTASAFIISLPNKLLNIFITFFAVFYLLRDGEKLLAKVRNLVISSKKDKEHIFSRLDEVMYGVLFGGLLVALIQGVLGAVGFIIFGVSSPIAWGMVMFILALIPYVGTGLIWGPAAAFMIIEGFSTSDNTLLWKGIGLAVYGLIIVSSIDNIIKPKIIGHHSRVHPVLVLVGIFGGLALIGIPGIIVGPVAIAMAITFLELYIRSNRTE